jgi:hypothetical protein
MISDDSARFDPPILSTLKLEIVTENEPAIYARSMILRDIRDIFAARLGVDRLSSATLVDALGAMENRPWSEWRNGKPITAAALARLLGPFGITPGTKRHGSATFKGYLLADFADAFESYLPNETVTSSQPNNDGLCDGVTVSSPWEQEL